MFRDRVEAANAALPTGQSGFDRFKTNPYVLLMYAQKKAFTQISQIAEDLVLAKAYSSLETSAGKMVEDLTLPAFGWTQVNSEMHTPFSALDGLQIRDDHLRVVTLKSGPSCLNDRTSQGFADAIMSHCGAWAERHERQRIDFTYGVLYGTPKRSNKKDWHIARKLCEKVEETPGCEVILSPENRWTCEVNIHGVTVNFAVRIGTRWWDYLTEIDDSVLDILVPLIRSCVRPGALDAPDYEYEIHNLADVTSLGDFGHGYNSALLQQSQLPWLMLMLRHFYDSLT